MVFCFKLLTEIRSNRGDTIFLLDEPANNLHYASQSEILTTLENLSKKGENVVLYSTHSPVLIPQNNRIIAVINDAELDGKKPVIRYIDLDSDNIKSLMDEKKNNHYQNIGLLLRSIIEKKFIEKEKSQDIMAFFKSLLSDKCLDRLHKLSVLVDNGTKLIKWFIP